MDARSRRPALVGLMLMASAVLLPWARVGVTEPTASVSGFDHGLGITLLLAAVGAVAVATGSRGLLAVAAVTAIGWITLTMYALPGGLLDDLQGVGIAEMSYGAYAALAGAVVLAGAAARRSALTPRR